MINKAPYTETASTKRHNLWFATVRNAVCGAFDLIGFGYIWNHIFSNNYTPSDAKRDALIGGVAGGAIGCISTFLENKQAEQDEAIRSFRETLNEKETKTQAPQGSEPCVNPTIPASVMLQLTQREQEKATQSAAPSGQAR